jgi:hypothetical protein
VTSCVGLDCSFVVDESGFEFQDEGPEALERTLMEFLSLLDYANKTEKGVLRWSEIFFVKSHGGRMLHELLFQLNILDRDVRLLFGHQLDKVPCWDDDHSLQPSFNFAVGQSELSLAPAVGLCVAAQDRNHGMACLTTDQAQRRGSLEVVSQAEQSSRVHFLVEAQDAPAFWRSVVVLEDLDALGLQAISRLAFPRLEFSEMTWPRIDRFEGKFRDVRQQLIRDLSGLNDYAIEIWHEFVDPARIKAEMSARSHVNISRESPNTHQNAKAMAERTVNFRGTDCVCEWHTKLEGHRNRIHFDVRDRYVLVGIFDRHLA